MAQTAIITGGSGAIGGALARALAPKTNVIITYCRQADTAKKTVEEITAAGYEATAFSANLALPGDAAALADFALTHYGRVDLLVNCAGRGLNALITETTDEQWDEIFDANIKSAFHTCRAVLPDMIRRGTGAIINISSIWGLVGASCEVAYSASKAAMIGFTKALAKEVAPSGITVNCVAPGLIDTPMNAGLDEAARRAWIDQTPLMRTGTPEDVARAVLYLAEDRFTTGQVISPNGGVVI